MSTQRKLIGLFFAILFDAALGLASLYVWSWIFPDHKATLFGYGFAVFFALFPDADVVMQKALEGRITGTHKNIMHYPLVVVPLVCLAILPFSSFWSLVAGTALLAHYVHDTIEQGPGIAWFAPLDSKTKYRLRRRGGRLLFVMTPEELEFESLVTLEDWLEREYLKVTPSLTLGVITFVIMTILVLQDSPAFFGN